MAENTARLRLGLQGIAKFLKIETQKTLKQKGKRASGELIKSVDVVVKEILDGFVIEESQIFYGAFKHKGRPAGVDVGRRPKAKKVPIDAIEAWLKIKNFSWAADNIRGKAFAVQANIFEFGIKPTNWIAETLSRVEPKLLSMVRKATRENLEIIVDQIFKETDRKLKVTI